MKFKNFGKIGCFAVVMAVAGSFGLANANNTSLVYAASSVTKNIGDQLQLTNVKTNYKAEDIKTNTTPGDYEGQKYVVLPTPSVNTSALTVTATNSSGKSVDVELVNDNEYRLYLSGDKGVYYVTYTLTSTNGVETSREIQISIDAVVPSFDWNDENVENIIPEKINPGKTIVLPYPSILDQNGDYVTYEGNELTADYLANIKNESTIKAIGLTLKLVDANKNTVEPVYNAETGYYEIKLASDAKTGKWTLSYVYEQENSYTIKKTYNFQVVSTEYFNPEEDVSLKIQGFKDNVSIPTSMELNVESPFPYATIVNTKDGNAEISVYTILKITCTPADGSAQVSWNSHDNPELFKEFKFKPTIEGNYQVEYTFKSFYGKEISHNYGTIYNVRKGTTGTTVYVVEGYSDNIDSVKDITSETVDEAFYGDNPILVDATYKVPTKVKAGQEVELPAIFAVDLTDNFEKLAFTRTITNKTTGVSNSYSLTQPDASRQIGPEETIKYTFEKAGEYSVRYSVKDSTTYNSSVYLDTFTVVVEEDFEDTTAPVVDFNGLPKTITAGKDITFTIDASDYKADSSTEYDDTNLKLVVTYQFDSENPVTIYPDTNGEYKIEVPADASYNTVSVNAVATDDSGNETPKNATIIINNYSGDTFAPEINVDGFDFEIGTEGSPWKTVSDDATTLADFEKGDTITLPKVTFSDNSSDLVVTAYVEHVSTGNVLKTFFGMSGSGTTVSMGGIGSESFQLQYSGLYRVTYVATDVNNNIAINSFEFNAISNTPPSIYGVGNISTSAEYGDEIDIVSGITIYDGDTIQTDYNIKYLSASEYANIETILSDESSKSTLFIYVEGACEPMPGNIIKATDGTITLRYWSVNANGKYTLTPQVQTISAEDTTAPTFYINENLIEETHEYDSEAEDLTNYVFIPNFENLSDTGSGVDLNSKKVVVKYSDSTTELTIKSIDDISDELFTESGYTQDDIDSIKNNYLGYVVATKNGTMNITYTVSDKAGNTSAEKVIAIACGDITPPTLSVDNVKLESSYNVGSTLSIDMEALKVSDDSDTEESSISYKNVVVTVTCDGKTISKDSSSTVDMFNYKIENAGNYIITFTVSDSSGNSRSETLEFTVNQETNSPVISTTVWGTVVIILSLLVLGGVIYMFVKPTKGNKNGPKGGQRTEKKEQDSKIQV